MSEVIHIPVLQPKPPRHWGWLWILLLLAGIGLSLGWLWWYLNQPATGKVLDSRQAEVKQAGSATSSSWQSVDGVYIRFSYPSRYNLINNGATAKGTDSYYYTRRVLAGFDHLAIAAEPTSLSLNENGSYLNRKRDPNFTEEVRQVSGQTAHIMTRVNGEFEKTAFILKGKVLITVALNTANNNPGSDSAVFDQIIASLQFR